MPEGDTIHKLANSIRPELQGQVLEECLIRGVFGSERLAGSQIENIEVLGKHMLIHFDRDLILRVHLGMKGSWHRYLPERSWKRPKSTASVVLRTEAVVFVCFEALDIEVIPSPQRKWHRQLNALGPDLLGSEEPKWELLPERARELHQNDAYLGEVLLDQRIAAGIGNVYKSELAFMGALEGDAFQLSTQAWSPWLALAKVPDQVLVGLFQRARILLQANLGGWYRTTTIDRRHNPKPRNGNLWVYGKTRGNCFRCQGKIEVAHQGLQQRITYWCPDCQKA